MFTTTYVPEQTVPTAWQHAFRHGIAPSLSTKGLEALRTALATDDRRLIQNATTFPPPLQAVQNWPVAAGCAVCLALWQGDGLATVGEVEEAFALVCLKAGERLGDPTGARYFLNWFDSEPRGVVRRELLKEVNDTLAECQDQPPVAA